MPISFFKKIFSSAIIYFTFSVTIQSQTFPTSFAGVQLSTGLDPVAFAIAPDGRVFLTEKSGKIWVLKNDSLLSTPFVTIAGVDTYNERGLDGLVLDPDFATNNFVYAYYTHLGTPSKNRVVRFTAMGNVAKPNSDTLIFELDSLNAGVHNGGGLVFKDGKLMISAGENHNASNAQSFQSLLGKVLRINPDGSIPADNPFYSTLQGKYRSIYALGFRNPFRMAIQPGTGKIYVNDVGESSFEEINELSPGKNYGWPTIEGLKTSQTPPANYVDPIYNYSHSYGCAITGGAFYNPTAIQFPATYVGKYFFSDYCNGWIKTYDPNNGNVSLFASSINRPIDIKVSDDGSLYYIARGGQGGGSVQDNTSSNGGVLWKVKYIASGVPVIAIQPNNAKIISGTSSTFFVEASGTPSPSFQWQKNGVDIVGANSSTYTTPKVSIADNGSLYDVIVNNPLATITSKVVSLNVIEDKKPIAKITLPDSGSTYIAGNEITFSGTATGNLSGHNLPDSAYSWKILLYHFDPPAHFHPAMDIIKGIKSGTFLIPSSMETSKNVLFRIYLTVKDSLGIEVTDSLDVKPVLSTITLVTNPLGLPLNIDGLQISTPYQFIGAAGVSRELSATTIQNADSSRYDFYSWSDGGEASHFIFTPQVNTTLTCNYIQQSINVSSVIGGVMSYYYNDSIANLSNLKGMSPVKIGSESNLYTPINTNISGEYQSKGYIKIPKDGLYNFYLYSNNGSQIYIGNLLIIDNDSLHSNNVKQGNVYLREGFHTIDLRYYHKSNLDTLTISFEGPTISMQSIPDSALFSQDTVKTISDIHNLVYPELTLYPNPSSGIFYIDFFSQTKQIYNAEVYNSIGNKVFSNTISANKGQNKTSIDITQQSEGIYYVILSNKETRFSNKFQLLK